MNLHFYHHHYPDTQTLKQLDRIEIMLDTLLERIQKMSLDFAQLADAVAAETTVTASAIKLLEEVATALRDAAGDQERVNTLASQIQAQAVALGAAVAANTVTSVTAPTPTSETSSVA